MNNEVLRNTVTQLCISGIVRCLRSNVVSGAFYSDKFSMISLNLELLKYYWALSDGIEEIAKTVVHNPRRLTTDIDYEEVEQSGIITGSINAGATMIAQARTLNPALFIVLEPLTTSHSLPNQLVSWVLSEAFQILFSARKSYPRLNEFDWFNNKIVLLEQALRNEMLREVLINPSSQKRPNGAVLRSSSKAKLPIYQKAIEVFYQYDQLENGDLNAIIDCLSQTLLAKLEYWQMLELASALMAANALSMECNSPIHLTFPIVPGHPVAKTGDFEIYWQFPINHRSDEYLDPSELWSRQIAKSIGFQPSDGRADVVVLFNQKIVAIFECKYFETESTLTQSVLDACNQIVRYARDAYPNSDTLSRQLLNNSCIIVSDKGFKKEKRNNDKHEIDASDITVHYTDIEGLTAGDLNEWAKSLRKTLNYY